MGVVMGTQAGRPFARGAQRQHGLVAAVHLRTAGGQPHPGGALLPGRAGAGSVCEGPPGLRPHYHANYYGAYFRDLDGNKLCVCCHAEE